MVLSHGIPRDALGNQPRLSLTHVQWITEIQDEDDEDVFHEVAMFDVVGEQYRLESLLAAATAIANDDTYQPARFWLLPDNNNQHDMQAVAVYATASSRAFHVGFLSRHYAPVFRESMNALGRMGQSLEVLGCITAGKTSTHPNARLYLPVNFAEAVQNGFADDSANHPAWLQDTSPVPKRPPSRRGEAFTDTELCKIYCRYAKQRLWFNFPNEVEGRVAGYRASGLGSVGEVVPLYYEDTPAPSQSNKKTETATQARKPASPAEDVPQFDISSELLEYLAYFDRRTRHDLDAISDKALAANDDDGRNTLALINSILNLELARRATLKDLFKSWDKWIEIVESGIRAPHLQKAKAVILEKGKFIFHERYREILREEFNATEEKAFEKTSERAQAKLFQQLLARVSKATQLGSSLGIDQDFVAFEEECRPWTEQE